MDIDKLLQDKELIVKLFKNKNNKQISFILSKKKIEFLKHKKIPKELRIKIKELIY